MKIPTLSVLFVSSLMLLAAFNPALALTGPMMSLETPAMTTLGGSYNWSGYAVLGAAGSVSSVSGQWIVPMVTAPFSPFGFYSFPDPSSRLTSGSTLTSASSPDPSSLPDPRFSPTVYYVGFWVGIDGVSPSTTLEQAGIAAEVVDHVVSYSAFYEFLPSSPVYLTNYPVCPGDEVCVTVACTSYVSSAFSLIITDKTAGWTYRTTGTDSGAADSSAEWIAETPTLVTPKGQQLAPLADFGIVTFDKCCATIAPYSSYPERIGAFSSLPNCYAIIMLNYPTGKTVMANPTPIASASSTGFSIIWRSAGP